MYYEINIAYKGAHFFATAKRSLRTEEQFTKAYKVIRGKFKPEHGYHVSATHYPETGHPFDTAALDMNLGFSSPGAEV